MLVAEPPIARDRAVPNPWPVTSGRKVNVYGIRSPPHGGYDRANPPQELAADTVTLLFLEHFICISGVIVALVEPTTDGSMLKVIVPGICETEHVLITVPLTLPIGSVAVMDPGGAVQLMVSETALLFP